MNITRKVAAFLLALAVLPGCGGEPVTHPVQGKVVLKDGDVKQLADAQVEFQLVSDPKVRASGLIASDGRFEVQTLHKGRVVTGMPPGKYQARLLFEDDGDGEKKKRRAVVRRQFLDFKTSGLAVTVPGAEEVILVVSGR